MVRPGTTITPLTTQRALLAVLSVAWVCAVIAMVSVAVPLLGDGTSLALP